MSNRLFQGVIHQMKDAIDRTIGVVDETSVVIACSELGRIGEVNESITSDTLSATVPFVINGHTFKSFGSSSRAEYAVFVSGSDEIAQIFGLPSVNWNIDTLDWQSRNADAVVEVVQGSGNLDGCIVLMHSIYSSSAEATERLVPWLQEQGYQFVTVSELLQYKYGHTPIENKHYGYYFDQPDESDGE